MVHSQGTIKQQASWVTSPGSALLGAHVLGCFVIIAEVLRSLTSFWPRIRKSTAIFGVPKFI